jgi:molybdopterin-guanine dinucleotide biosynthesis protein A
VHALREAQGRSVVVCAGDMPLVSGAVVSELLAAPPGRSAVPFAAGRLQPLLARYDPTALAALESAPAHERLVDTVRALAPRVLRLEGEDRAFFNVNSPEDLRRVLTR